MIIAGDFNYRNIDWENQFATNGHRHLEEFIDTLQECFLFQHVTEPTRYRENEVSNLLDLILSSEEGMVKDLSYHPPLGQSDHICLRFKIQHYQKNGAFRPKRNVFKSECSRIKDELMENDWLTILNSDFKTDYDNFTKILYSALESHTPLTQPPKKKKNIYMTNEAIRLKNSKARLWKRYLSTKSRYAMGMYKRANNELRRMTRILRSEFEQNIAKNVIQKPKMFWRYAKSRLQTRQNIPTLENPDGSKATSVKEKANTLNKFFCSVFTTERLDNILELSADFDGETLSTAEITPEIVWRKLVDLNPNKSPGPDKWHPHFLRKLADVICIPLSIILNKSLKEDVHKTWLKAIITAIYKKGVKSMPENYRPASLTSVISKIMESIIRDAIISHMTDHDLISDAQHGFVPGRNCLTQLLICMEDWTSMLEKREVFDLIYTDFSKAFDSVPHQRLYIKLHNIGIGGHILKWIKSLLTGRTQCVSVEGEIST